MPEDIKLQQTPDRPPIDKVLEDLEPTLKGKPFRVRIQPTIYNYAESQHLAWPSLIWQLELQDADAASRLRVALSEFFLLTAELGTDKTIEKLRELRTAAEVGASDAVVAEGEGTEG